MTRQEFLTAYRKALIERYPSWAHDEVKLNRFMQSVEQSISGGVKTWNHNGDAVNDAWRAIGGKRAPTFKALCQLAA